MKFISILLTEGRKQDLEKKYKDKFSEEELSTILNNSVLIDTNYKYGDFVLKNLPKNPSFDNIDVAINLVQDFNKFQSNLEKKDINQYKNFEELDLALSEPRSKVVEKDLEGQTEKIYEDDNFLVLRPLSIQSSCKYGAGTKWCVTQKNADHFQRYTSGDKKLYFILRKKGKLGQPFYKVAVHFTENGNTTWWDAEDRALTTDAIELFKEYNPELWDTISSHFKKYQETSIQKVKKIFDESDVLYTTKELPYARDTEILIKLEGYENIPDMPKRAMGRVSIFLNGNTLLDEYDLYITYNTIDDRLWKADIVFGEESTDSMVVDLGLGYLNLQGKFRMASPQEGWDSISRFISDRLYRELLNNRELATYLTGGSPVWRPNLGYGYKFGENKGLIKKIIDWLDSGKSGTRLDFLTDIGYLKRVEKNGKNMFRKHNGQHLYTKRDLRGQHASFFASAVLAGIIQNVKQGRKFIITKGPNFDAFKEGKLRAL